VHLVGFIMKKFVTMHGHMSVKKELRGVCIGKFAKFVHLVGFIIKTFVTMHGHMSVKKLLVYNVT
jgi:predicted RNA-binding protein YlqC (UPF0109 family)